MSAAADAELPARGRHPRRRRGALRPRLRRQRGPAGPPGRRRLQHRAHDRAPRPAGRLPGPPLDRPLRHQARADARRRRRAPRRRRAHRRADHAGARRARRDRQRQVPLLRARHVGPRADARDGARLVAARRRDPARRDPGPHAGADGRPPWRRSSRSSADRRSSWSTPTSARGSSATPTATAGACAGCWRAATWSRSPRRTSPGSSRSAAPRRAARMLLQAGPRRRAAHARPRRRPGGDRRGRRAGGRHRRSRSSDTIGAGDAFGGGFLAWWRSQGFGRERARRPGRGRRGGHLRRPRRRAHGRAPRRLAPVPARARARRRRRRRSPES